LVDDLLAVSLVRDQTGVREQSEMPRNRRPGDLELGGDGPGRERSVLQELEDLPALRIGEGAIYVLYCHFVI